MVSLDVSWGLGCRIKKLSKVVRLTIVELIFGIIIWYYGIMAVEYDYEYITVAIELNDWQSKYDYCLQHVATIISSWITDACW